MIDIAQFIRNIDSMDKRLPPLQSLLAFEAAARLGGISRAAVELSLTQSAITHQIQNLEAWVGQQLFSRVGRGVKLTAAGALFGDTVRATLKTLRDGRERIEPYRNQDSVLLACPPDFASGWLMSRLRVLRVDHPTMEVWLITQDELREIDRIDVDLIISTQELKSPDMDSVAWLDDEAIAVCGPVTASQLLDLHFPEVLRGAPLIIDEHYSDWAPWLGAHTLATRRGITLEDSRLRLQAAEDELGIAMLSRHVADAAIRTGRVVVLPQIPTFTLPSKWLCKSKLKPRTPAVEIVFEWLRGFEAKSQ
jgi:LysR family glycine cleavage system transcriptional activator